jgi:hypothetical protein
MHRAVLAALVSVALVTAVGTLGATVVGDTVRDTGISATGPFIQGDGLVGPGTDQSTDGADDTLPDVDDALRIGSSTDGSGESESQTGPGSGETDPTASETPDGDGPPDGVEVDPGADATGDDADGDGVPDDGEAGASTDPTGSDTDTDGDGLSDSRELELGTDPTEADTDGDGLPDGWEVTGQAPTGAGLPGADPLSKDIYVQFDYSQDAERRGEAFYDALAAEFAEMPVDNPDNSSGVDVHVIDGGSVDEPVRFTGDNFWTLKDRYYEPELEARAGVYHQVMVASFSEDQVGYGEVGGQFSVVASDLENETARRAVTHELLHNVVGRVEAPGVCPDDPKHYCGGGYLSPRFEPGEEQYLAEALARQLERQGFAE